MLTCLRGCEVTVQFYMVQQAVAQTCRGDQAPCLGQVVPQTGAQRIECAVVEIGPCFVDGNLGTAEDDGNGRRVDRFLEHGVDETAARVGIVKPADADDGQV